MSVWLLCLGRGRGGEGKEVEWCWYRKFWLVIDVRGDVALLHTLMYYTFSSDMRVIAMGMSLALTAACIMVRLKTCRWAQLPPSCQRS